MSITNTTNDPNDVVNYSYLALMIICVFSIICFFLDVFNISNQIDLWGRSGALITVSAVVLEFYLLRKLSPRYTSSFTNGKPSFGNIGEVIERSNPTKEDDFKQGFATTSLICGTVIWGFGDLINEPMVRNFFSNMFC